MRTMRRAVLALALGALVGLPACAEFDHVFPWNWHVPKKIKPYDRLPGKADIERKRQAEQEKELEAQREREELMRRPVRQPRQPETSPEK